jgi:hypothetical protein
LITGPISRLTAFGVAPCRSTTAAFITAKLEKPLERMKSRLRPWPPTKHFKMKVSHSPYAIEIEQFDDWITELPSVVTGKERADRSIREIGVSWADPRQT